MAMIVTSVTLDENLHTRVKEAGWNMSALVRTAMDIVVSDDFEDFAVIMKLKLLGEMIEESINDTMVYAGKAEQAKLRTRELEELRDKTAQDYERVKYTSRLNGLTRQLARIVVYCEYDKEQVMETSGELVEQIISLNPKFDLEKYISRLHTIMDD